MNHALRRARLSELLAGLDVDALLVSRLTNVRYLTGFRGTGGFLLAGGRPLLWVDFRYAEQARQQAPDLEVGVASAPPRLWPELLERLASRSIRLGYEAGHLTAGQYLELAALPGVDLVPTRGLVEGLRSIKDGDELDALRQAVDVADKVMETAIGKLEAGLTENRMAGEIELAQRSLGSERSAVDVIVASGPRTSLPHGVAGSRVIQAGEPVMMDIAPVVQGYRSDLTRTVHLGRADDGFRSLYELVLEAQHIALDGIRAGITGRDADALARSFLERHGHGEHFRHSLGHSFGLDTHETPLLSPHDLTVLEPGMVVTVEPGVYLSGRWGVRIEDVVVIRDGGCEILSRAPKDLIEL